YSSLKLDLHRRDFTINTLAISLNKNIFGQLIDFFGAQRDIKEKTIRVLHSLSFVEDPTRVFRAIRFEHRFGFQIGKHTMNLIKNAIKMNFLSKLRGKRISIELSHIMREDAPEKVLKRLQELDLMRFISPYLTFDKEKERLFHRMHTVLQWYELLYQGKPCDTLAFWVLGLVDPMTFPQIEDFCRRTEMTESFKRRTLENSERLRSAMMKLPSAMHTMTTSEIYNLLEPLSQEVKLFIMAKTKSEEVKKAISNYITYKDVMKPVFTGKDLKKLGIKEGPVYKAILERLKGAKIDLNLRTKEEEEEFVRSYMAEQGIVP
ncbi:MAG TPA: polya polymerase, partial [Syntrophorhabdus aromaticivorans]|nr:polya polymerase [Syntrophorhabdus aromaticivorans]